MTVYELSREQITELKADYICKQNEENGEATYWSDIIYADDIISDDEIYREYSGVWFVENDFLCTAGR